MNRKIICDDDRQRRELLTPGIQRSPTTLPPRLRWVASGPEVHRTSGVCNSVVMMNMDEDGTRIPALFATLRTPQALHCPNTANNVGVRRCVARNCGDVVPAHCRTNRCSPCSHRASLFPTPAAGASHGRRRDSFPPSTGGIWEACGMGGMLHSGGYLMLLGR